MKSKLPVITKRILSSILIFGFILCSLVFGAGYWAFSRQFKTQYDTTIRSISEAARECLDVHNFEFYVSSAAKTDEYAGVEKILSDFVEKFDLNMIYVSTVEAPEYTHITYIYNPIKKNGRWREFPLGYKETYVEEEYNQSARQVFEEGKTVVRHTLKTRSGSHITAMVPVFYNEKVVAVLGVQKNIQEFVNARHSFTNVVVFVEIVFAILFIFLFSSYFNTVFIKPLLLVTKETDHFASYGGQPSDKLLSIKNQDEIGTLAHSVHQMEYEVCKNIAELTKVTAEKERISTELSVAAKIQTDMLPKGYPPFPERRDFDLFASMTPAKEVGGDLYDYLLLDEDHLMITVGDVSGKGVPAALFMGKCKVLLDFYAYLRLSPKDIFEKANEQLCKGNESALFVTCWLGIYTFSKQELTFVNAGHPYPIIYKNGEYALLKEKPNIILGYLENTKFVEHTVSLKKGEKIFIYTDGVTEAENIKQELFGEKRLLEIIKTTEKKNAMSSLATVKEEIDNFAGNAEQFDDITMLQFEIL